MYDQSVMNKKYGYAKDLCMRLGITYGTIKHYSLKRIFPFTYRKSAKIKKARRIYDLEKCEAIFYKVQKLKEYRLNLSEIKERLYQ